MALLSSDARLALKAAQLRSGSVVLEPLDVRHADLVVAWRNHPQIRPYFFAGPAITREGQLAWTLRQQARDDDFTYVIRDAGNMAVGMAAVYDLRPEEETAEFGRILVAPDARGHGHAAAAIDALRILAFERLGLRLLYACCRIENLRIHAVLRKAGFRELPGTRASESGEAMLRFELHATDRAPAGEAPAP